MNFFTPAWMSKNSDKAQKCVRRLTDEKKLLRAALESPHQWVRTNAAERLQTDESFARLLKESKDEWSRCRAARCVKEATILQPYMKDQMLEVRYYALKRNGRNKEAFGVVKIASNSSWNNSEDWVLALVDGFSQDDALVLAQITQDKRLARALVEKLDNARLSKLMFEGTTCGANFAFDRAKVLNIEVLRSLAMTAKSTYVQNEALKKLNTLSSDEAEQVTRMIRSKQKADETEDVNRYINHIKNEPLGSHLIDYMKKYVADKQNRLEFELACVERYFAEKNAGNLSFSNENDMRNVLQKYLTQQDALCAYLLHEKLDKGFARMMIREVKDETCLGILARQADCNYIRWKACKKNGGHVFDTKADEKDRCTCSVCGFVEHLGCPNNGHAWTCERCGAVIEPIPFVDGLPDSTIRYSDGTEKTISGYSGHYCDDDSFNY